MKSCHLSPGVWICGGGGIVTMVPALSHHLIFKQHSQMTWPDLVHGASVWGLDCGSNQAHEGLGPKPACMRIDLGSNPAHVGPGPGQDSGLNLVCVGAGLGPGRQAQDTMWCINWIWPVDWPYTTHLACSQENVGITGLLSSGMDGYYACILLLIQGML